VAALVSVTSTYELKTNQSASSTAVVQRNAVIPISSPFDLQRNQASLSMLERGQLGHGIGFYEHETEKTLHISKRDQKVQNSE
jgi:hypothetical protein